MAAKKNTSQPAADKGKAKPTVSSSKAADSAKKPSAKKTLVEKPVPAKKKAEAPSPPVAEKPAAVKSKAQNAASSLPKQQDGESKAVVSVKKAPVTKPRSSVVDFPAPPAPVKPPFVPPKSSPAHAGEPVAPGNNGSHSPAFVQKQRQRLLDLRDDLVDAVSGMARDTIRNAPEGSEASGSGQHQGDAGSDAYDRDFALSVLAKEQDALYEIEQALRRIQSGSYGICEISVRKIPQARLEAIPFARLTVECQAQWEKEYGNRRFRPSNEVGFSGGKYVDDEDSETVSLDEDDD
jgi:DnaK suppressor protein